MELYQKIKLREAAIEYAYAYGNELIFNDCFARFLGVRFEKKQAEKTIRNSLPELFEYNDIN